MTEPTASPDVTGLIERLTRASKRMKEALDREVMPDPTEINNLLLMAQFRFEEAAGVLLALRQEVERLTDKVKFVVRENRSCNGRMRLNKARAETAEASLRLATQRREDVVEEIAAERERQKSVEGWTAEHDDKHDHGELAYAAACYALAATGLVLKEWLRDIIRRLWPWDEQWFKHADKRRSLVKAGALIVAEIDRLDRHATGKP